MISAVIVTLNDEARLKATLAALTAPAIDGFVREVIVADAGSTDATLAIADEAGARIVRATSRHRARGGLRRGAPALVPAAEGGEPAAGRLGARRPGATSTTMPTAPAGSGCR